MVEVNEETKIEDAHGPVEESRSSTIAWWPCQKCSQAMATIISSLSASMT